SIKAPQRPHVTPAAAPQPLLSLSTQASGLPSESCCVYGSSQRFCRRTSLYSRPRFRRYPLGDVGGISTREAGRMAKETTKRKTRARKQSRKQIGDEQSVEREAIL